MRGVFPTAGSFFLPLVALAALAASATGCAASAHERMAPRTELGPPEGNVAQVCVLRTSSAASDRTMRVHDNGRLVGATRGTTYVCWLAGAGDHQITSEADETGPTLLHAEPGARYWFDQDVTDLTAVHAHLTSIGEREALERIEACEARVMLSVPGHDDSAGAMPVVPAKRM